MALIITGNGLNHINIIPGQVLPKAQTILPPTNKIAHKIYGSFIFFFLITAPLAWEGWSVFF